MNTFYHRIVRAVRPTGLLGLALLPLASRAQTFVTPSALTPASLTALNAPYLQDFTILDNAAASNVLPTGWGFVETGTAANSTYGVPPIGSTSTDGTYSMGATTAADRADRAFGTFLTNITTPAPAVTNTPIIGAAFRNNTGQAITGFNISYTGEQWRLGNSTRVTVDRLDFQYSTTATALNAGTYTDVNALDFNTPVVNDGVGGTKNGNIAPYRTALSAYVPVTLAAGATIFIRWVDIDVASGSDDALAVDDFSLTAVNTTPPSVTTAAATVSGATATLGGNVTSAGSAGTITGRGVVYSSTNMNPTLGGTGVTNLTMGAGPGAFSGAANGLALFYTTYYAAAYATSSAGTGYGPVMTFSTGPGFISLATANTAYTQDFNTLASSGTTNAKNTLPQGWDFIETDLMGGTADNTYSASTATTGNTFSLGGSSTVPSVNPNTERALGGIQNTNILPTIGAAFINNTGQTLLGVRISYTGEQWRLGNDTRTAQDRIDFQYSTNATDLLTGTFTDHDPLDFSSPIVGTAAGTGVGVALDGNLAANRRTLTATLPMTVAPGATLYIRWLDFNATGGADDPLGIDDFALTPLTSLATAPARAAAPLVFYPNPAQEQLAVTHPAAKAEARVTIYSATGQVVRTAAPHAGSTGTTVSLANLAAGIYLVEYLDGTQRITGKVVKE